MAKRSSRAERRVQARFDHLWGLLYRQCRGSENARVKAELFQLAAATWNGKPGSPPNAKWYEDRWTDFRQWVEASNRELLWGAKYPGVFVPITDAERNAWSHMRGRQLVGTIYRHNKRQTIVIGKAKDPRNVEGVYMSTQLLLAPPDDAD